jgi:hypothetical protein
MLFWIGASELLQPFNPLLKFILVKTVVFLTFWQVCKETSSGLEENACMPLGAWAPSSQMLCVAATTSNRPTAYDSALHLVQWCVCCLMLAS